MNMSSRSLKINQSVNEHIVSINGLKFLISTGPKTYTELYVRLI